MSQSARDLVIRALSLVGSEARTGTLAPSAWPRIAVESLVSAGTADNLQETRPDMRALLAQLLDWQGPKATGATTKAASKALLAKSESGVSLYPQAVEALSFAAACAPLLDPDRLAKLIEQALQTKSAYGPILAPGALCNDLVYLLSHFQPQRRFDLLISLWESAHDGLWWEGIFGLGKPEKLRILSGEQKAARELYEEEVEAFAETLAEGSGLKTLFSGEFYSFEELAEKISVEHLDEETCLVISKLLKQSVEHGAAADSVVSSYLVGLTPAQRTASPIPTMVTAVVWLSAKDGPEAYLPKKPKKWVDMYPGYVSSEFPIPQHILMVERQPLPGTEGSKDTATVQVVKSSNELFQNAKYMGNCTAGTGDYQHINYYRDRIPKGEIYLLVVVYKGETYNAALERLASGQLRVREKNSRFNKGDVPNIVETGVEAICTNLNDFEARKKQQSAQQEN